MEVEEKGREEEPGTGRSEGRIRVEGRLADVRGQAVEPG